MSDQDRDLEQLFQLDDAPGPARPIDDERAAVIIGAVIGGAGFGPGNGGGNGGPAGGGGGPAGGGGKLFLLGGAGAIAIAAIAWIALRTSPSTPAPSPVVAVHTVAPPVEPSPSKIDPSPATVEAEHPALTPPSTKPGAAKTVEPKIVAPKTVDAKAAPKTVEQKTAEPTAVAPKAEDLLAEANRERVAHNWREADALYTRVVSLPHAPQMQIQIALVASGSLHLEHFSDPRGASTLFQRALALDGALAEDARWGIVEAARANNDTTAERAALEDFLSHHPQSPLAERARLRSKEL